MSMPTRKRPRFPKVMIGKIGEITALHFLRENRFRVYDKMHDCWYLVEMKDFYNTLLDDEKARKWYSTHYCSIDTKWEDVEEDFEHRRKVNIEHYQKVAKKLETFVGKDKIENFKEYLGKITHYPDFVAKKSKKIYIVEVKANTRRIDTKKEMEDLMRAKDYGFIPMLVTLNVIIETADIVMECL